MADTGFHLDWSAVKAVFHGKQSEPFEAIPQAYVPAPAIPRFTIRKIVRAKTVDMFDAPISPGMKGVHDVRHKDGPHCQVNYPHIDHPCVLMALCGHCGRSTLTSFNRAVAGPGAVVVSCRR